MADTPIPLHEITQTYGVTEECRFNDHWLCHSTRCGCDCHQKRIIEDSNGVERVLAPRTASAPIQASLEKHCPSCGGRYEENRNYCTLDGAKLSSLRCQECSTVASPEDNYCGYCGFPIKQAAEKELTEAVAPEILEPAASPPAAKGQPIISSRMFKP